MRPLGVTLITLELHPRCIFPTAARVGRGFHADGLNLKGTPQFESSLRAAVKELVAEQKEPGLSLSADGGCELTVSSGMECGAWWSAVYLRVSGSEVTGGRARSGCTTDTGDV